MADNPEDIIFIGKKPLMSYVNFAVHKLSELPAITIKARGMSIGRAVDVAQITKKRNGASKVEKISIDSESLESTDGKTRNVSTIEITLARKGQ